jgi:RsiW-degrading membrane proteinase PrsW (M82 family)
MSLWLSLFLILGPASAWIGYFYYYNRFKPEPLAMTAFAYLLGFLSAWLCLKAYYLLPLAGIPVNPKPLIGINFEFLAYCLGVVGLAEESCKLLPFLVIIHFSDFDKESDGFFYASVIALGFAAYENLSYIPNLAGFPLLARAVTSPLTHTIFASLWGFSVGMARIRKKPLLPAVAKGLGIAALAHGLFDFFTFSTLLRLLGALLIMIIWLWRIRTTEILIRKENK